MKKEALIVILQAMGVELCQTLDIRKRVTGANTETLSGLWLWRAPRVASCFFKPTNAISQRKHHPTFHYPSHHRQGFGSTNQNQHHERQGRRCRHAWYDLFPTCQSCSQIRSSPCPKQRCFCRYVCRSTKLLRKLPLILCQLRY